MLKFFGLYLIEKIVLASPVKESCSRLISIATRALLVIIGMCLVIRHARCDRDIVFSAQYYRWSGEYYQWSGGGKKEQTLSDIGTYHLYTINPDGTGRKQITFGKMDDFSPHWSPDGSQIAFIRSESDVEHGKRYVCILDARDRAVREIYDLTWAESGYEYVSWSPDGSHLAVKAASYNSDKTVVTVINTANRSHLSFPKANSFAWSPDGRRLYLGHEAGKDTTYTLANKSAQKVAAPICNPVWLNNSLILGEVPDEPVHFARIIKLNGGEVRRIRLYGNSKRERPPELHPVDCPSRLWPKRKGCVLVLMRYSTSGGGYYTCYVLDYVTGQMTESHKGEILGFSGNGKLFASTDDYHWIGPYKWGGRRCGPLLITNTISGKARAITGKLVNIAGGDWRKPHVSERVLVRRKQ